MVRDGYKGRGMRNVASHSKTKRPSRIHTSGSESPEPVLIRTLVGPGRQKTFERMVGKESYTPQQ